MLYFSVKIKEELSEELIDGRYFQYYTKEWLDAFLGANEELKLLHYEENENRSDCFASYFLCKQRNKEIGE